MNNQSDRLSRFPGTPYPVQRAVMNAILEALDCQNNAMLESPTGTGKTLALLTATFAWLDEERQQQSEEPTPEQTHQSLPKKDKDDHKPAEPPRRIVYVSRTHAQLKQIAREFRRTPYAQRYGGIILSSREQTCIHPDIRKLRGATQARECQEFCKDRKCPFSRVLPDVLRSERAELSSRQPDALSTIPVGIRDLEDSAGIPSLSPLAASETRLACPYYYARSTAVGAELVLMPYTYLVEPRLRSQLPFDLEGCILIVDEAHNLAEAVRQAGSQSLAQNKITAALADTVKAHNLLKDMTLSEKDNEPPRGKLVSWLQDRLSQLTEALVADGPATGKEEVVRRGDELGRWLQKHMQLSPKSFHAFEQAVEMADNALGLAGVKGSGVKKQAATPLNDVLAFLQCVFEADPLTSKDTHRMVLYRTKADLSRVAQALPSSMVVAPHTLTLGFWCLDPSPGMRKLVNKDESTPRLHSLLLASGTLAPTKSLEAELGIPFAVQHTGAHVIDPATQLCSLILPYSTERRLLQSSFAYRSSPEYAEALAALLQQLSPHVPDGLLVFFASYSALESCTRHWRSSQGSQLGGLSAHTRKRVFVEPRDRRAFEKMVKDFRTEVDLGTGGILLAVCRGKGSEGMDFTDRYCRCVVLAGIPFANSSALEVRLRRQYLDSRKNTTQFSLSGEQWYCEEAMRMVNQAVGRVIRHRNDFGAIVFADVRFGRFKNALSPWLSRWTQTESELENALLTIQRFFQSKKSLYSQHKTLGHQQMRIPSQRPASASDARRYFMEQSGVEQSTPDQSLEKRKRSSENPYPSFKRASGLSFYPRRSAQASNTNSPLRRTTASVFLRELGHELDSISDPDIGFRDFMLLLSSLRKALTLQVASERHQQVQTIIHRILSIFLLLPEPDIWKQKFTVFLPEAYRPLYVQLISPSHE